MKYSIIGLCLFLFFGCAKNPFDPLPPIQAKAETFNEHINRLKTPSHTYFWLDSFAEYNLEGQLGWNWKELGFSDLAYSLAYSVWNNSIHGLNVGVCGQFAATYVVGAREHWYDAGFVITLTSSSCHAMGWVVEEDGQISITDNKQLFKNCHKSKESFFASFGDRWFNKSDRCGYIYNNKLELIVDTDGTYIDVIRTLTEKQSIVVLKALINK